jgi:hypothetical protein
MTVAKQDWIGRSPEEAERHARLAEAAQKLKGAPHLKMSEWESRVAGVFSHAVSCKASFAEYLAYKDRHVRAELLRQSGKRYIYSPYIQGFVQGLESVHWANLYRFHLDFCYLVDGVLYSTHKTTARRKTDEFYARGEGHLLNNAPSGHYWIGSDKKFS